MLPRLGIVFLGLAVFAFGSYALYPGWYSFDSAYLLYQARTGDYSDLQPLGMALAWSTLLRVGLPPGALLVVHLLALVCGVLLLAVAARGPARFVFPLLLLWPPFLVLFGHLWVDVSLAAALVLATGWVAWCRATERHRLAWLAALPLAYAACTRHNAVFAVLPFFVLLLRPSTRRIDEALPRLLLAAVLAAAAWGLSALLAKTLVERPVPAWTPTALWDIAAVSIRADTMLLPPGVRGPELSLDELRAVVNPHESVGLITGTKSGIAAGIVEPYPPGVREALLHRWLTLPVTHTEAWLAHRLAVARSLLGMQGAEKPEYLFITPRVTPYRDNPALELNGTEANTLLIDAARALKATILCAPVAYFALGLLAVALSLRRKFAGDRGLVLCLAASAWLAALPLPLIVPAAEWRYLLWPMLASLLALVTTLAGGPDRAQNVDGASSAGRRDKSR